MNRDAQQLREDARGRTLGAHHEVHVVREQHRRVMAENGIPATADDKVWAQPYGGGIQDPAILPFVLVENGLGPGHHEVQLAVEHMLCHPDPVTGEHVQKPYTLVIRTSWRSFAATAKHMDEKVQAWGAAPDVLELPFMLDLYQQCADEVAADEWDALDGPVQAKIIEWLEAVHKAEG